MNELDPELLYEPLEDEEEENDTDGSSTNSSTDSLEEVQEHAEPVIAGLGGGISHSGSKGEGVSASNSPHNASNKIPNQYKGVVLPIVSVVVPQTTYEYHWTDYKHKQQHQSN